MPSFNIGLTGLNAASSDLQVTGHNIANSSTAGFKRSRAEFADVFALSYTGVSKTATGSGVNLASVTQQFTQGDLNFTDNNLDLAINGQGFFILDRGGITEYTRAGQFQVDREGFMVNAAGQRLMGYPPDGGNLLQPIRLTTGDAAPRPTTTIDALMNLSSEADPLGGVQHVNLRGEVTPQELLNVLTVPGGLNDIDDITIALNAAGEVEIQNNTGQELRFGSPSNVVVPGDGTATQLDASVLQPGQRLTWNFDGDLGTGRTSELPATVTANYLEAAISGLIPGVTAVAQADGSINVTNNTSNPVTINFPGGEFSLGTSDSGSITAADIDDMEPGQFITLTSAGEVQAIDPQDPDTFNYSTSLTVYDSLGSARTVSLFVQRQPPPEEKTWDVAAYMDIGGEQVKVGESKLAFKNDGTLDKTATQPLVLSASGLPNGAADLNIEVDFGQTTQYGNKFSVAALRQDGYAAGQLVSVDVDTDGTVFARYSNGANRPLGQVALANFDNPQGLQPVGGTNWVVSSSSGEPLLGRGGESNFGLIQGGAYEAANVNIADQLVKLITAQRNFQANAQVISTADTLTQTIINIR